MNAPGCGGFIPTFAIVLLFIRREADGMTVHWSSLKAHQCLVGGTR
jgi:hypothetical protein